MKEKRYKEIKDVLTKRGTGRTRKKALWLIKDMYDNYNTPIFICDHDSMDFKPYQKEDLAVYNMIQRILGDEEILNSGFKFWVDKKGIYYGMRTKKTPHEMLNENDCELAKKVLHITPEEWEEYKNYGKPKPKNTSKSPIWKKMKKIIGLA